MDRATELPFFFFPTVRAGDAGLFISRGRGRHVDRIAPFFDLIFVRQGRLEVQEEDRPFRVDAGETLLLWPHRHHWGTARYLPGLEFYWVHFVTAPLPPGLADGAAHGRLAQQARVGRPDRLALLFDHYLEDSQRGHFQAAQADALLHLILLEVAAPPPPAAPGEADPLAVRAFSYIRMNHRLPLTASRVAQEVGCNPDYLARLFRASYGMTLTQCIHGQRLDAAKRRLVGTDKNIAEIAREVGFADVGYFGRVFKRAEKMTALAYRRRHTRAYVHTE
jgi:AraC-like DNA-binding protein